MPLTKRGGILGFPDLAERDEPLPEPCPQDDAVLPGDHLAAAGKEPPALLILSQPLPPGPRMRDSALCLQPPPAR